MVKSLFIFILLITAFLPCSENEIEVSSVFSRFETGIKNGNVEDFFSDLDSEIYLSIKKGVSGYFSSNQSYYLLSDYLREYSPLSFNLYRKETEGDYPYAFGSYYYKKKGVRGNSKVFISLKKTESSWKISQITFD
jgi:hypothetical protein